MPPHPPESHTPREAAPEEPRPREARDARETRAAAGGSGRVAPAASPFSRRVDQFARQIATMRRHAALLRRPARPARAESAERAADRLPAPVLDDLHGALESLHAAEEELYREHEELGRVRASLDDERRLARRLFDESPVPALVTASDGTIRDANRAALALLGADADALARRPLASFLAPDDRRAFHARLAALPGATDAPAEEISATLLPREGAPIDALVVGRATADPASPGERLVHWVVRDVTAERAAERERLRVTEELAARVAARTRELAARTVEVEAASREKSSFLATLSHEIRTPVTAVVGYADLLEAGIGGPLTSAQRSYVDRLRASTGHLLSLVEGVLDLAKVEAGRVTLDVRAWPAHEIVEGALAIVRPQAEARRLRLEHGCCDAEAHVVLGDQQRVRQVLVNLLANAVRFTPDGGTVSVRCGRAEAPPARAATTGDGPWSWIAVADTGVGIPSASLAAVFEPFVQTEPLVGAGGSGLGLPISRRLARLMRGDVVAESEPGRGSTFTLWLPATAA